MMNSKQRFLINIGLFVQFPLAALGHVALWLYLRKYSLPGEADVIASAFVEVVLPVSLILLLVVYVLFRYLLAKFEPRAALSWMISFNAIHSLFWCLFLMPIPLLRLLLPTILYVIVDYSLYEEKMREIKGETEKTPSWFFTRLKRIHLNLRAGELALWNRWMKPEDVAASYDRLAGNYDGNWLVHLRATTDRLHDLLPETLPEDATILELGCGSGYSTVFLREKYPKANIHAVDISVEMIAQAKKKIGRDLKSVNFYTDDMLAFLRSQTSGKADLIFSGWAIGYSNPEKIIRQSARCLARGGTMAVVVNRLGTMPVVFDAFRQTMRTFPGSLNKAVWPRFPKGKDALERELSRSGFRIECLEEAAAPIPPPPLGQRLEWLLSTGVLAGFDEVLPLRKNGPVRDFFAERLDETEQGWEHCYVMFVAKR